MLATRLRRSMTPTTSLQLGRQIALLRERAGLNQADLAQRVTLSPSVISRVEAGERPVSPEEFGGILEAIGTSEARRLETLVTRQWEIMPDPGLDHPDHDDLWAAEQAVRELDLVRKGHAIKPALARRVDELSNEIQMLSALVAQRSHQVAFIGTIGIGKSTAICRMTGLEIDQGGKRVPVLESGAGGITLCQVDVKVGPGFGVLVEPQPEGAIRAFVSDLVDSLLRPQVTRPPSDSDDAVTTVPREVERAIRNMAGLARTRVKGADGKRVAHDPARELADQLGDRRALVVEVLARMELHRRDRRDLWHDRSTGMSGLEWLRTEFLRVNNGRHPDISLPARIELVVPELLSLPHLDVSVIDTRGIDTVASRADLDNLLSDPHTVSILCTGFNDAPATAITGLLERARLTGNNLIETNAAVLALPRPQEALAVKDDAGLGVDHADEGYELKGDQVQTALAPLGFASPLPIHFFNAFEDDPHAARGFLEDVIHSSREVLRKRLVRAIDSTNALVENLDKEQVLEVQRAAGRLLLHALAERRTIPAVPVQAANTLLQSMRNSAPATINAAVSREGEWQNLSYRHELGQGARQVAVKAVGRLVDQISAQTKTLSTSSDYSDARELLDQAARVLTTSYGELLRKIQVSGETAFDDDLREDRSLWRKCMDEWGRGPGYRDRVSGHNDNWFNEPERQQLEDDLHALVQREWESTLDRVGAIFDVDEM
ncbi:MAG: helix-turn-helix domain-containing protein [Acidimicrobiales bacterium]